MTLEHRYELSANVSMLFAELPLLERFPAAAAAGFGAVELWWPFAEAAPPRGRIDEFVDAVLASGLRLSALNLFGGDLASGERGIASLPARRGEFLDNLDVVLDIALRTGCRLFNTLYGARDPSMAHAIQHETATTHLARAMEALAPLGGTVLIEPLSGIDGYPIRTPADALAVLASARSAAGSGALAVLFDIFHLASNGVDLRTAIDVLGAEIAHVQLADAPGRGAPGTGSVDVRDTLDALRSAGYRGLVACEYTPAPRSTVASLDWIARTDGVRLGGNPRRQRIV